MAASMFKFMVSRRCQTFRVIGSNLALKTRCLTHCRCCTSVVNGDNERTELDTQPKTNGACRTNVSSPKHQTKDQLGQFYTVPQSIAERVFTKGWVNPHLIKLFDTFNETSIMVRKPALEIIDLMKNANYEDPVIRYVIYGPKGTGKTTTLAHVAHYAEEEDFMIFHVSWPKHLCQYAENYQVSLYKEDRFDLVLESLEWMQNFKQFNKHHLSKFKTTKDCVWSKRDTSPQGTPITDLMDMCMKKESLIPDVVGVIIREVKQQASELGVKVLVAIDGANGLFDERIVKVAPGQFRSSLKVGLIQHFQKLLHNDWTGGAVVVTVDKGASNNGQMDSDLPKHLLGKQGFAVMDPFIPFQTDLYSEEEFNSCIEYFKDRRWFHGEKSQTETAKQQLKFLSGKNPFFLERACTAW